MSEPTIEAAAADVVPGPVVAEPVTAEPVTAEPVTAEPVTAEPVTAEPVTAEPVTAEPVTAEPVPTPAPAPPGPRPSAPRPSPALLAATAPGTSPSAKFGRVDESGTVFVRTGDGEKEVGAYPGAATPAHALGYFARKYDELAAQVDLLLQRLTQTELGTKESSDALTKVREQVALGHVVGDLDALDAKLAEATAAVNAKKQAEGEERAAARRVARAKREELVTEAESIAGQPEAKIQWKTSGARMRELLDEWKEQQRTGPRLDRESETTLWHRFSQARNGFDKARRVHFAHLEGEQNEAKSAKEKLVGEAESLAVSQDWAPTATAFKKLMDRWRAAGRASRSDDDALWERFKTAQDSFFAAKDAISAKEDEEFTANLTVKVALIAEADSLLPVRDVEAAKSRLRGIQDRWEKAGKVPRADVERTEKALRRVESSIREADEKRWSNRNPEAAARAQSFADQLQSAVDGLRADLATARESGNQRKIAEADAALATREQWLAQARAGVEEFG